MTVAGEIYVLANSSIPNLVKVGKTSRSAEERAEELSRSTSSPVPFIVIYRVRVGDIDRAESYFHTLLEQHGLRLAPNREFFLSQPSQVVDILVSANIGARFPSNDELATSRNDTHELHSTKLTRLVAEGFVQQYGAISNPYRAEELYNTAKRLGSIEAYSALGGLYSDDRFPLYSYKRALNICTEGYELGNLQCLIVMANLLRDKFVEYHERYFDEMCDEARIDQICSKEETNLFIIDSVADNICQYYTTREMQVFREDFHPAILLYGSSVLKHIRSDQFQAGTVGCPPIWVSALRTTCDRLIRHLSAG